MLLVQMGPEQKSTALGLTFDDAKLQRICKWDNGIIVFSRASGGRRGETYIPPRGDC